MNTSITIREIVTGDYRTADVFHKWGINYCCSGNVSISEACRIQHINEQELCSELEDAARNIIISNALHFSQWPVEFLTDYMVYVHHAYVKQSASQIADQLLIFSQRHTKKLTHMPEVPATFQTLAAELLGNIQYEEEVIFPYIKQLNNIYQRQEVYGALFVRTLRKPLTEIIQNEHGKIISLLKHLQVLTGNYSIASDMCTAHVVVLKKLQEFDSDLVQHKHLENNILFPKAIKMESELLQLSNIR